MLSDELIIDLYKKVLSGELDKFPRYFWKEEMNRKKSGMLVRFLLEDYLQFNVEQIKEYLSSTFLRKYKLAGMLKYMYDHDYWSLLEDAYPNQFKPWDMKSVPNEFWRDYNNCILATKWLLEEKLGWTHEDIKKKFNKNVFLEHGFSGLLKWGLNGETRKIIHAVYPQSFKEWELEAIPLFDITKEDAIEALRWFIEEKMKWSKEDVLKHWRVRFLKKHGMFRLVQYHFKNHMFEAINAVYPHYFKPNQFPKQENSYIKRKCKKIK